MSVGVSAETDKAIVDKSIPIEMIVFTRSTTGSRHRTSLPGIAIGVRYDTGFDHYGSHREIGMSPSPAVHPTPIGAAASIG